MDCLEIVSVRLARKEDFELVVCLCREILTHGAARHFKIYRSLGHATDLSVHIPWAIGPFSQEKSLLGQWISRSLGDYGLVSHTLWTDQQENSVKAHPEPE